MHYFVVVQPAGVQHEPDLPAAGPRLHQPLRQLVQARRLWRSTHGQVSLYGGHSFSKLKSGL